MERVSQIVLPKPTSDVVALGPILDLVAQGNRVAFEELYRLTSAKLFGICLRILPDRQEAEDALQDAYLSVWRRAGSFDVARGSGMAWLVVLARNVAIDRLRAKRDYAPLTLVELVADPARLVSEVLADREHVHQMNECLAELDAGDAQFIRTAFFEGATYAELATRAALPLGTVKSRIRRALLRLRECLA